MFRNHPWLVRVTRMEDALLFGRVAKDSDVDEGR